MIRRSAWGRPCFALLFLLSLLPSSPAQAGTVSFASPHGYGVGLGPWAVALGDFSGGGILDVAAVDYLSNTVSVLAGNGNGTFSLRTTQTAGGGPTSAASPKFS